MKRSSLTLITLLIAAFILIASIPVIYTRELARHDASGTANGYVRKKFLSSNIIKVIDAPDVVVIPADLLSIEYNDSLKPEPQFVEDGDTLIIRANGRLFIHSANNQIVALRSQLEVRGTLFSRFPPSLSFILKDSRLYSKRHSHDSKISQHLDMLSITGKGNSIVDLSGRFNALHLVLKNINRFSATNEVGFTDSEVVFDKRYNVTTLTCPEGVNIYNE